MGIHEQNGDGNVAALESYLADEAVKESAERRSSDLLEDFNQYGAVTFETEPDCYHTISMTDVIELFMGDEENDDLIGDLFLCKVEDEPAKVRALNAALSKAAETLIDSVLD